MANNSQEINYNELVNPTFTTGQATLEMLAASGNQDAKEYIQRLGLANATERFSGSASEQNQIFTPEEGRALMMGVTMGIEARYAAVSRLLKESGYNSVLDIACGYTPRALMCRNAKIDYVGLDLPAVVDKMAPLTESLFCDMGHPAYVAGDVTNAESVKKAADLMEGELFITSEGLMTYLNKTEMEQMIISIRRILSERGGAWYSSDMGVQYDYFSAVAINKPDVLERWAKIMGSIKKETDVYFYPVSFESMEEKIAFFEKFGMKVELVPFYTEDTQLNILNAFDPESQARLKGLMQSFSMWKITVAEEAAEGQSNDVDSLQIAHHCEDAKLHMSLQGRLDTLSAPDLMKLLDDLTADGHVSDLILDLSQLEYMSSTGLRVLLMMTKRLGGAHVCVEHPNALVRELFETTGFADVVTLR